jgi:hypothetical protein
MPSSAPPPRSSAGPVLTAENGSSSAAKGHAFRGAAPHVTVGSRWLGQCAWSVAITGPGSSEDPSRSALENNLFELAPGPTKDGR